MNPVSARMARDLGGAIDAALGALDPKVVNQHAGLLEPITSLRRIADPGERIFRARTIRMRDRGHRMHDQPPFFEIGDAFDAVTRAAHACVPCAAVTAHVVRQSPPAEPGARWRFVSAGGVQIDGGWFLGVPVKEALGISGAVVAFGLPMHYGGGVSTFAVLVDLDAHRSCLSDPRWTRWLGLERLDAANGVVMRRPDGEQLPLAIADIDWSHELTTEWVDPVVPEGARSTS